MQNIARFGEWSVAQHIESKTIFPKRIERDDEGNETTTSFPLRKFKRILQLTHDKGGIVCFAAYLHAGTMRYKDSREPKKSHLNPIAILSEIQRMLDIGLEEARGMLGVG
jgi:hypothetical protein